VAYYPKLTVAVPFTPATGTRLLVHPGEDRAAVEKALLELALETAQEEELSSVHVLFPSGGEAERLESSGLAHRLHTQFHWQNPGYASWDEFLSRFTSKQRSNIRRERGAAEKQGVTIRTVRGDALSGVDPALVHRLYASTVDKHMWGRRHLKPRFFERVLETMRHRVEVVLAEKDGRVIAGAFNVGSDTHLYGRYWGCFEELPFLHFHVALYHSIEECIRTGRKVFEGGAGGEHKLSRGFEPSLTHSAHFIAHRGLDQAVRRYLAGEREATLASVAGYRSSTGLRAAGGG
jgi:predicted N-acyltransferase